MEMPVFGISEKRVYMLHDTHFASQQVEFIQTMTPFARITQTFITIFTICTDNYESPCIFHHRKYMIHIYEE